MAIAVPTISGASLTTLGGNLVINKPTGTAQGDFLVCYIICSANTTITPPSDTVPWDTDVTAAGIRSYSKIAGASEPSTYTFTRAAQTNNIMGIIVRVTGAHATSPKDTFGSATGGSGTTVTLPTLTVTNGFTLLQIAEIQASTSFTPPAGPSELFDQTFATQSYTGAVGLETVAAGATGTRVWTAGASAVRAGVMYALKEPPILGDVSGTTPVTTAALFGSLEGASTGSTPAVTAAFAGSLDGVVAAQSPTTVGALDGALLGDLVPSSPRAISDLVGTYTPPDFGSGAIAGATPAAVADLAGSYADPPGDLDGTTSVPTGALAGTLVSQFAGSTPTSTAAFVGTYVEPIVGTLAGTTPAVRARLSDRPPRHHTAVIRELTRRHTIGEVERTHAIAEASRTTTIREGIA